MAKFRFQDLEIWKLSLEISDRLFDIADDLEKRKLYRFADQLRGSGMSVSNNISEGSGSFSNAEFKQYLNIARRSVFENANILIILNRKKLLSEIELNNLLEQLDLLSRKITSFRNSLNN
jgi:four helix bundle protein